MKVKYFFKVGIPGIMIHETFTYIVLEPESEPLAILSTNSEVYVPKRRVVWNLSGPGK